MSAYLVHRAPDGSWCWSEASPAAAARLKEPRPATAVEATLMEKIVWHNDTAADRARLRELLNPGQARPEEIA